MGIFTFGRYIAIILLLTNVVWAKDQVEKINKSAVGVEFGGNGTLLVSDSSSGAFGLGAGYQGSIYGTMWNDRPIGAKVRLEYLYLREESIQKANTDYISQGSFLKSMTQRWTVLSAGAEGRFNVQGQSFFWEATLGYAFSGGGSVAVTSATPDGSIADIGKTVSSGFVVGGGLGLRKVFKPKIVGVMGLRTQFLTTSTYSSDELKSKFFMPIPLIFNIGMEVPF